MWYIWLSIGFILGFVICSIVKVGAEDDISNRQ